MSCHKAALESLQEQGVRLTAQRALILEDLYHHSGHRTAEDVFHNVSERLPGLNRATVYRTLELFRDAHVVTAFNGPDGIIVFELVRGGEDHHHHLICSVCGAELALEPAPIEELRVEILARTGFQADLRHLVFTGLCANCLERRAANREA